VATATPKFVIPNLKKKSWKEALVDEINDGKVVPIVSASLCNDLIFGSHQALMDGWAESLGYPLPGRRLLPRMTQYQYVLLKAEGADNRRIKMLYDQYITRVLEEVADAQLWQALADDNHYAQLSFSQKAAKVKRPALDNGQENPLLLLASLPLPIYITTSYHDVLAMALAAAGKTPHAEICYWERNLRAIPSVFDDDNYMPDPQNPLVFHLHGRDAYRDSLVLTEDDYFDFLVAIAQSRGDAITNRTAANPADAGRDAVPVRLRQALADSALLLLGFGLFDWDFRTLFRGLIKPSATSKSPKSVALQLDIDERQRDYVEKYLRYEAQFEVELKSPTAFLQELYRLHSGDRRAG
jgi:hypothetical protein